MSLDNQAGTSMQLYSNIRTKAWTFPSENDNSTSKKEVAENGTDVSILAKDMVTRLLQKPVSYRITMTAIKTHPWVTGAVSQSSDNDILFSLGGRKAYTRRQMVRLRNKNKYSGSVV